VYTQTISGYAHQLSLRTDAFEEHHELQLRPPDPPGRPAVAGDPRDRTPARPKVLLRRGDLRQDDLCGAFVRRRRALRSHDRASRRLVHARLLRPRGRSGSSFVEGSRGRGLRGHPAQPYPFVAACESQDAEGLERGRLRFPPGNPLRDDTHGSRTSRTGGRSARQKRGHVCPVAR
jgi:hypothetical protein